jgi:hypothetical protein
VSEELSVPQMTPEQARQVLAGERAARAKACEQAIQAVLAEHRCTLDVALVLRAGELPEPQVRVVALPDEG